MPKKNVKYFDNSIFAGIPKFFGGKRKISSFILNKAKGEVFIDAFLGAGSIAILAKALNKQVICNDHSVYSSFIGQGIIQNNSVTIDKYDIFKLFVESKNNQNYCEKEYAGDLFTARHARFIDNAAAIINIDNGFKDPIKKALMNVFLIKFIMYLRPYGNFTTSYSVDFLENPETIAIPKSYKTFLNAMTPIIDLCYKVQEDVNQSVFYNGYPCKYTNMDVIDFLKQTNGDTVYFDPPYFGAESYEFYYDVLNSIIMQKDFVAEESKFNKSKWLSTFNEMLGVSQKIPNWIISFGCEKILPKEFLALVAEHRPKAILYEIPYHYSIANSDKNDNLKQHIEILITAEK